jgi:predicted Rossmann fold flavoprotein
MIYDVVIVGAGAAGLMTAITASGSGLRILLLEGQAKVGAKILMSGGTRCNVTNKGVSEKDYNSRQIIFVRNILRSFNNERTLQFFEDLGVEMVLEPTGKYFPATHSGKTVLDALLRKTKECGITLLTGHKVKGLAAGKNSFTLSGEGFHFEARNVVLTTGGLSYPSSGSDGTGLKLAQALGHPMIETAPALTPLMSADADFKTLSGIAFEAQLTLLADGKPCFCRRDGFLFTHFGFSGPAALDISRHWLKTAGRKQMIVNFIPAFNEDSLRAHFSRIRENAGRRTVKSVLNDLMPERLADVLLKKAGIEGASPVNQLEKQALRGLMDACLQYSLDITGVYGYGKAEATAGGVDLAQVNPKTLESRIVPGLFFAGEILDVDGRIGGFNFQWAWSSGRAVGEALCKGRH